MSHIVQSKLSEVQETKFRQQLLGLISNFSRYEDPRNKEAALRFIPVDDLTQIAEAKCRSRADAEEKMLDTSAYVRDLLLLELLTWFKEEFFTWTDKPSCPICSKGTQLISSSGNVTPEEKRKSASRVEVYSCSHCSDGGELKEIIRFPRYNDPVVLLETRTGRCGEWANCFSLICRAMNFEIRHVTDWSDHVWVEVFSTAQNRWLHCDPCENKCDIPLLYELGWGKKIAYVIAVSHDEIQDVTWRYSHSKNHKEVLARRNLVNEYWLVKTIFELRKMRQRSCSPARLKTLEERLVKELVEFISPTKDEVDDAALGGRESGSLTWRLARQEIRTGEPYLGKSKGGFIWEITRDLVSEGKGYLEFFYDSVHDECFLGHSKALHRKGWEGGVFEAENIARKEEKDWRMVYLARNENQGPGMNAGKVSWKFELAESGLSIHSVQLKIPCHTFNAESGGKSSPPASVIVEMLTSTREQKTVPDTAHTDGMCEFNFRLKPEVRWVLITCHLTGGTGSICWQQAQVFRESLTSIRQDASGPKFAPFVILTVTESPDAND